MQFREVAWSQQLYFQRLLHGEGAEVTERSLPNYPGSALRAIIAGSGHPHNLEPLLLTLRRPVNTKTRASFADAAGELVLIEKVTNDEPIATDFQVALHGRVTDAADGILYPTQEVTTRYETWLRLEMLDVLALMLEEGRVRSLVPEMQARLISDMLGIAADASKHELIRVYALSVAVAAAKRLHAPRRAALSAGFAERGVEALAALLHDVDAGSPSSALVLDPFEQLKGLGACVEALYLAALCGNAGDYALAGDSSAAAAAAGSGACRLHVGSLAAAGAAPLLARALTRAWALLAAHDAFEYVAPPRPATEASNAVENDHKGDEEDAKTRAMREAAEDAAAEASMSFEQNWNRYLKAVYDTPLVPGAVTAIILLGGALAQALAREGAADALPPAEVLHEMAACTAHTAVGTAGAALIKEQQQHSASKEQAGGSAAHTTTIAAAAADAPLLADSPEVAAVELEVFGKLCSSCGEKERPGARLLRCGACGCGFYCKSACQKADWRAGHKVACAALAKARSGAAAAQ